MKRIAIQLSHELEVPRHDDLQADDRYQASCRDRLTLTETVPSYRHARITAVKTPHTPCVPATDPRVQKLQKNDRSTLVSGLD